MNITFIRRRWSATGGAENYLLRINRLLQAQGHTTRLVCEQWLRSTSKDFNVVTEFPIHASRSQRPKSFADKVNNFLKNHQADCVFSLERGIRADIYRAGDGVHRTWLKKRAKYNPFRGHFKNLMNRKNHILCELERFTFNPDNTRHVIANSEMVKKNILKNFDYPDDRIDIIYNGVDYDYFSKGDRAQGRAALGISENEFLVLLVGFGSERKGHIYARRVAEKTGLELMIIESPQSCPMPSIYAAADVFLLPTLYDPFANVTLEAMAAGLPVITTDDNGASEIIEDDENGFLVSHASKVSSMIKILRNLRKDETLRKQIGQAAQKTAQEHSMEKHIQETLALCERVIKERQG